MAIRFVALLRRISAAGLAGALAGILVGGIGGRLFMRLAAVLSPDAAGGLTDNGEVVGAITPKGTLALLLFGGLASGMVGGILWVVVSPWLPAAGRRRVLAAGAVSVALTGLFVVRSGGRDFTILEADAVLIALLLVLVAACGVALAWLEARLDRILPAPSSGPVRLGLAYGAVVAVGSLAIPLTVAAYTSFDLCACGDPPWLIAWALGAAGLATVIRWAGWIRSGSDVPPPAVRLLGSAAVVAAAGLGTVRLAAEAGRILGG